MVDPDKILTDEQARALRACAELAGLKPGVSVKTSVLAEALGWDKARVVRVMRELEQLDCVGHGRVN